MACITPRRWSCMAFADAALANLDAEFPNARKIVFQNDVYAIALSPDSDVDSCLIRVDGQDTDNNRILVSSRRPWVGHLTPGSAVVVPRRLAWPSALGALPDEYKNNFFGAGQYMTAPFLRLDIYGGPEIDTWAKLPTLFPGREPQIYTKSYTALNTGVVTPNTLLIPGMGRGSVSFAFRTPPGGGGGAAAVSIVINGIDAIATASADEVRTQLLSTSMAINAQTAYEYAGVPFEWYELTFAADTGTALFYVGTVALEST